LINFIFSSPDPKGIAITWRPKPQKLSIARAQSASKEKLDNYYKELSTILTKYNLHDKPEHFFNVDETSVTTEHSPPKIVCNKKTKPQVITSGRSYTVTIIAGAKLN
jgi:uracil phosphoribosyltransferase